MRFERRHYKEVAALTTDVSQYVPANGERLSLLEIGGNGSGQTVKLVWDYGAGGAAIQFSTNGDSEQSPSDLILEGDGVKVLAIVLVNAAAYPITMGGYWIGSN